MLTLIVGMKGMFLMMGLDNLLEKLVEVFEVFVSVSFFCAIQMELKKREKGWGRWTGKKEEMSNYNLFVCGLIQI